MAVVIPVFPAAAADEVDDFRSYLDQARFFLKKRWYEDALAELEAAVTHDDGRIDPEAWFLLANVRYELCDLEGARIAAERAHSFSRDDDQLEQAAGFAAFLREQFGLIELRHSQPSVVTKVSVELTSVLFDPGLKEYVERTTSRLQGKDVLLPHRLGLPAGTYEINGKVVTVAGGEGVSLEVPVLSRAPLALQVAQVEVSGGLSVWLGRRVDNLLPAGSVELALTQPVGPLLAGVTASWAGRPYTAANRGIAFSPLAGSVGVRVGRAIPGTYPMVLRPSVGYRFEVLPGVEVPCARENEIWTCGVGSDEELIVYSVGRMHVPYVELAAHYLELKERGLGVGLKATGDLGIGALPKSARAESWEPDADPIPYVVEDGRTVVAGGFTVLVNMSLAL